MTINLTFGERELFPREGDQVFGTASTFAFSFAVPGAVSVTSPVCTLYKGTDDVSTTYLSGSASVSSPTITTKVCAITVADEYLLKTIATVDGSTWEFFIRIIIRNPWDFL